MDSADTDRAAELKYLNNAATSYPKPPAVLEAVAASLRTQPAEPGRGSGHADPLNTCRQLVAELFDARDPSHVILTPSATLALNLAIFGLCAAHEPGHILTSTLEHNSVLRPLELLRRRGWEVEFVSPDAQGALDPGEISSHWRADTRLAVFTHCSNVTGAVQPIEMLAQFAAERETPLLIDASQSAGALPVSLSRLPGRVMLAFAGHKGLYGPAGTGGLIVPDADLCPLWVGGTGVHSEQLTQPESLPLRYEAGTPNLSGIAGLAAGCRLVLDQGVESLGDRRAHLVALGRNRLMAIPGLSLAPLPEEDGRAGILAFNLDGFDPNELAFTLREVFDIEIRGGLHCAPLIHREAGLWASGCARASVGLFNDEADIEALVLALRSLSGRR